MYLYSIWHYKVRTTNLMNNSSPPVAFPLFSVSEDCTYFALEAPDFSLAEEIERDMEEHSQMWGLYEDWQQDFTEKAQQDWITFR